VKNRQARWLLLGVVAASVAGCYDPSKPDQVQPFVITLLLFVFGTIAVTFAVALLSVRFFMHRLGYGATPIVNGVAGSAVIESIADTGFTMSAPGVGANAPRYRLGLSVTTADGLGIPYPVQVTAIIPRIYAPMIMPGANIGVIVDPADPNNVRIDFNRLNRPAS
jgi:hypothetical protein